MSQSRRPDKQASLQPDIAEKFLAITQKQLEDRKDDRLHEQKKIVYQGILLGAIVFRILGITGYLAVNGQKEVAIEIVKYVAPLAAGGFGEYGLGYAKGQKSKEAQKETT